MSNLQQSLAVGNEGAGEAWRSSTKCWKKAVAGIIGVTVVGGIVAAIVAAADGNGNGKVDGQLILMWQTAGNTSDRLLEKTPLHFSDKDFDFAGPVVRVSDTTAQTIQGFGGAFTEASGKVFKNLSDEKKAQLMEDYFGKSGNGYTVGRTHINSCDFSTGSYSFDDVDGDMELKNFNDDLTRDTEALIPLIKAAQDVLKKQNRSLSLLATPWSPPAWMKNQTWNFNTSTMDHSGSPCLKEGMAPVWAKYFSKWLSAYKAHDIPIWAITVQNEPENNASWEACLMTAEEEADFLGKHLGPELASTHPDVGIFVFDHNKDHVYNWTKTIFSDAEASKYATGVAYHWYSGDSFDHLQKIKDEYPQAAMLASEATYEEYRWHNGTTLSTGDWTFGEGYAHDIIGDLNTGAIGWIDWNLILDENGGPNHVDNVCDAAVQANMTLKEVYRHPQYYYIGHFSRFILPGSSVLTTTVENSKSYEGKTRPYGTCSNEDGIEAVSALRPDGNVTVVVLNCGDDRAEFKLEYGGSAVRLELPPRGIQSYLFKGRTSRRRKSSRRRGVSTAAEEEEEGQFVF